MEVMSVLDCTVAEFKQYMFGKNLGEYRTHLVFITLAWERLLNIRTDLMRKINKREISEKSPEIKKLFRDVYSKMTLLENKAIYLRSEIKRIEGMPLN